MGQTDTGPWYWCLDHQRAEPRAGCREAVRLGPYPTREAAEGWKDRVEARNEAWDEDDKRWHGRR